MQDECNFIMKNDALRKVEPQYTKKHTNIKNENLVMI